MAPVWGTEISPVRGGSTWAVRGASMDSAGSADAGAVDATGEVDATGADEGSPAGVAGVAAGVPAEGIVLTRPVKKSRQAESTVSGLC